MRYYKGHIYACVKSSFPSIPYGDGSFFEPFKVGKIYYATVNGNGKVSSAGEGTTLLPFSKWAKFYEFVDLGSNRSLLTRWESSFNAIKKLKLHSQLRLESYDIENDKIYYRLSIWEINSIYSTSLGFMRELVCLDSEVAHAIRKIANDYKSIKAKKEIFG